MKKKCHHKLCLKIVKQKIVKPVDFLFRLKDEKEKLHRNSKKKKKTKISPEKIYIINFRRMIYVDTFFTFFFYFSFFFFIHIRQHQHYILSCEWFLYEYKYRKKKFCVEVKSNMCNPKAKKRKKKKFENIYIQSRGSVVVRIYLKCFYINEWIIWKKLKVRKYLYSARPLWI